MAWRSSRLLQLILAGANIKNSYLTMSAIHVNTPQTSFYKSISTKLTMIESSDVWAVHVIDNEVSCPEIMTTILAYVQ